MSTIRTYDQAGGKVTDALTRLVGMLSEAQNGNIQPFVAARVAAEQSAALRACIEDVQEYIIYNKTDVPRTIQPPHKL